MDNTREHGMDDKLLDTLDTESSASRQHFIDTGRYLRKGEVCPACGGDLTQESPVEDCPQNFQAHGAS